MRGIEPPAPASALVEALEDRRLFSAYDVALAVRPLPHGVLSGAPGRVAVRVSAVAPGTTSAYVTLYASADASLNVADVALTPVPVPVRLPRGKPRTVNLSFNFPSPDGPVYLLARASPSPEVFPGSATPDDGLAATPTPLSVSPPLALLTPQSAAASSTSWTRGRRVPITIAVRNDGNVVYKGSLAIDLSASPDASVGGDTPLLTASKRVSVKPGATKILRLKLTVPRTLPPASYRPVAFITPAPMAGVTVGGGAVIGTDALHLAD